ncbi:carbohydrate ABC transporter permease [Gardnerella vaginalis]|uniref:Carbohydrate ABC transporter permease n=3 Tax=Gardnerella vaginalis TaxID=2702 RepID=A0AAW6Y3Z7_GARVA|nr:carbohydrate ABC transporter permease [Gardnerella vaginalis]MDK6861468.1 carbohydrate ABC transporter permease [Gardnerella vaginalis]MDK7064117.1 carbohydrate ABC transporter permease [Gardnerella vaginalis]NSX30023.1 carbohydrate ABC transporter permease [Gardnerella vaginalis]PKZ47484.1 carbohydrate ABC transporter permease [Gardnerella vaginalis]
MKRKVSTTAIMYVVLVFFLLIWLFPIVTAISKSLNFNGFKSYESVITNENVHYFKVVFNSFLISISTVVIVVFITSLAGFAFSKMKFTGRKVIYILMLACMAVPIASVTMPLFFTIKTFGLINTYIGMIIPLVAFNALQMLLLWKNYFDCIPNEIIEAARVDGCSTWSIYSRILIPISTPMVATTGVLTFVYSWNEYLIPLLLIRDESKYTVTLASTYFMETRSQTPEMISQEYAALILMTIPSVIVYMISQKWLQSGITAGAVKN